MQNSQIAMQWLSAFNRHNLDELLSLYSEQAKHFSPKLKARKPESMGFIQGKQELQAWWADAFVRLPELQYIPQTITADEDRVFMEYIRKVTGEEDSWIAEVLEIENGLIVFSRVYHG